MLSQQLERRRRVFNSLRLISLLVKLNRALPIVPFVSKLDARLDAPEQIRHKRDKAMRRIPLGNITQILVDTKDLLEHDDAWSIPARRQRQIPIKLPTIESSDFDH